MAKIGIFPGSFNPIHKGHLKLIKYSLSHLGLDYLYLVPCYQSVDKINFNYLPLKHRLTALKLVKPRRAIISFWEINQNKPILTYKTIQHFKNLHPTDQLFLLIGSDYQESFYSWEGSSNIQDQVQVLFFNRPEYFLKEYQFLPKNNVYLSNPLWHYSSTKYREGIVSQVPIRIYIYLKVIKLLNKLFSLKNN